MTTPRRTAFTLFQLLLILALLDYAYQRFRTEKELKMSKQEVKEEMRRMEGDPKIKQRRRQIALQATVQRLKKDVPTADVVVTNPTHFAVALKYDKENMHAPKVVAKGADFMALRWHGVGIEGSDFSLKHRRANWAQLANTNLFTGDITKPFQVTLDGQPTTFHVITAWEVMEHIATPDLKQVFQNVSRHLEPGGYFIASTTETSDIHEGIELHQTQWTNPQWRDYVAKNFPELEFVDVGLKIYQFVRYNFIHPSFLLYRKRREA